MRIASWAAVAIALVGCKKNDPAPAPDPPPATRVAPAVLEPPPTPATLAQDLLDAHAGVELAVYLPGPPPADAEAQVKALVAKHLPKFRFVPPGQDLPEDLKGRSFAELEFPPIADYAPPSGELLTYYNEGLTDAQKAQLVKSPAAIVIGFVGPSERFRADYPKALRLIAELAETNEGFPWDEGTRRVYSREAWKTQRLAEPMDIRDHFVVHSYRAGDGVRMVSLGLARFGLPNLVANNVSPGFAHKMLAIINAVVLRLHRDPKLAEPGAILLAWDTLIPAGERPEFEGIPWGKGHVTQLTLSVAEQEPGDSPNRLVELSFGGGTPEARQIRQQALLREVLGYDGRIMNVGTNEELAAAQKRALAAFLALKPKFQAGLPPRENLAVKAPFDTKSGGKEFMWVDVTGWTDGTVRGVLMNTPRDIPRLSAGMTVQVPEGSVYDYLYHKADGSQEGNETAAIIQRMAR